MNDNIKIKIHEVDKTTAGGRGMDATDIAFVPGFSVEDDAPTVPTLCTTVDEFEALFGTTPQSFSPTDVAAYSGLAFRAGEPDRGYVYAKELLYQGMSVVYANLGYSVSEESSSPFTLDEVSFHDDIEEGDAVYDHVEDATNGFSILKAYEGNVKFQGSANLTLAAGADLSERFRLGLTTTADNSVLNFVNVKTPVINRMSVGSAAYSEDIHKFTWEQQGDLLNITRTDTNGAEQDLTIYFTVEVAINAPYTISTPYTFAINSVTGSILDSLYNGDKLTNVLNEIVDRNSYSIKYITSGGYPSINKDFGNEFAQYLINCAKTRGDAVALIDGPIDNSIPNYGTSANSYYEKMYSTLSSLSNAEYGTCMYPWAAYNCSKTIKQEGMSTSVTMPASFGYLLCVARAIKNSPNWLAMAGVSRGLVPGINYLLSKNGTVSNSDAENMQPKFGTDGKNVSINCITNIRPYGLTIWGNRTLFPVGKDGTVARNFLNIRNMISDIKKNLYATSTEFMFEQNSDALWLKFKAKISPFLDKLKNGAGISNYKILKSDKKEDGTRVANGELAAIIRIYPLYSVEYFDLTVELSDQDITVS